MTTAGYSQDQSRQALQAANAERLKRAELRRLLQRLGYKNALREAAHILADCPGRYARMPIDRFLLGIPKVGSVRLALLLRRDELTSISPRRRVGELTIRERLHIVDTLERLAAKAKR